MELEFADGGAISNLLGKGYLPLQESVRIIADCLFALEFAHSKQIIHGDIKPDNILLSRGKVKIADFGLAKHGLLKGPQRAKELFYFTHGAPELFAKCDISRSSDIYAAGITLFRLANNIVDWNGVTQAMPKLDELVKTGKLVSAIGYAREIPRRLQRVISRACSRKSSTAIQELRRIQKRVGQTKFQERLATNRNSSLGFRTTADQRKSVN